MMKLGFKPKCTWKVLTSYYFTEYYYYPFCAKNEISNKEYAYTELVINNDELDVYNKITINFTLGSSVFWIAIYTYTA